VAARGRAKVGHLKEKNRIMTKKLFWGLAIVFWVAAAVGHGATTANLLVNPGAESGDLTGWKIGFAAPRVDDGTFNDSVQPRGKFAFLGSEGEYASLWQRVSVPPAGVTAAQIDSGNFYAQASFYAQGLDQGDPSDSSRLALVFRDGNGIAIGAAASPLIDSHHETWSNFTASAKIPIGTRAIDYVLEFVRKQGSDLDAYFDDNSLVITDAPSAPAFTAPVIALPATLRDFRSGGDFEGSVTGLKQGLVSAQLDAAGKLHFIGDDGAGDIAGASSFERFFADVPGVNVKTNFVLLLTPSSEEPGVLVYERNDFFPIDNQLLGNEDLDHNFHFTIEAHSTFTFHGGEFVDLTADDDAWLYINGKLVIDLGGTHDAANGRVELNTLGLIPGGNYSFDLFYAERHTSGSTLVLKTNAKLGGPSTGPVSDSNWRAKYVLLYDTVEADCLVRVGDIDYLGFGWPLDYDIFSGKTAPSHDYPWEPDPTDPPGTDRIQVVSSFKGETENGTDGYTEDTTRPGNTPQPITLDFTFNGVIHAAVLQMFTDDFQPRSFGARYQVKLNGVRAPFLEEAINALDETGPVGKLISVPLPSAYLELLGKGRLVIAIDDPETGAGDGFAIDFIRLLINPKNPQKVGALFGLIRDEAGEPIAGALVTAGEEETISDDTGAFTFSDLVPGGQHLTARKEGFVVSEISVDIIAGQTAETSITLVEFIDTDGDGLSDNDEINIYHTDPTKADTDGDGMNDGAEIAAGTNPNSINTALRFTSMTVQALEGGLDLAFQGIAGHVYQLERYVGDDLRRANDPAWVELQTIVSQGGAEVFHAPTTGSAQGFFRIVEAAAAASADPTAPILEAPTAWPSSGTAAGSITLRVPATDNLGVTSVTFFDGVHSLGTASRLSASVWQLAWPITASDNGAHTITAQARDAAGNVATSPTLNFPVNIQSARQTIVVSGVSISADSIITNGIFIHISGNVRVADFAFTADTQITVDLQSPSISVHGQVDLPGLELPGPVDFTITRAEGGAFLN
jgi:fibro-slime domain-containing protein